MAKSGPRGHNAAARGQVALAAEHPARAVGRRLRAGLARGESVIK
jgi:hypothetical protein